MVDTLYETDDIAWAEQQVGKLRALAELRPNLDLDVEHLIEELDGMARSRRAAVASHATTIMIHELKLAHARDLRPRGGWQRSVDHARAHLEELLTASLRAWLEAKLPQLQARAVKYAASELRDHDDEAGAQGVLAAERLTLDMVLGPSP